MRFSFSIGTSGASFGLSHNQGAPRHNCAPPPPQMHQPAGAPPSNGLSISLNDLLSLGSSNLSLSGAQAARSEAQESATITTNILKETSTLQVTSAAKIIEPISNPAVAIETDACISSVSTPSVSAPEVPTEASSSSLFYTNLAADIDALSSSKPLPTHPDCVVPQDAIDTAHAIAQMTSVIFSAADVNIEPIHACC